MTEERWMEYGQHYIRRDDDSINCNLILLKIETGEVQLRIYDWDTGEEMRVGFANYIGGGRSPNVLKALESLALAIEKDNEDNPIKERDEVAPEQWHKNRLVLNKLRIKRDKKLGHRT